MAGEQDETIALMAIKPRFAKLIFDGEKEVEFRKVNFSKEPETIIVYATDPIQKVIGSFDVGKIKQGKPVKLWREYEGMGGINKEEFEKYFGPRDSGIAIKVRNTTKFDEPVSLESFCGVSTPPQNFQYLDFDEIKSDNYSRMGEIQF